jgi:Bacterial Ig domain
MKSYLQDQSKLFLLIAGLMLACCSLRAQGTPPRVSVVAPDPTAFVGTSSGAFTLIRFGPTNDALAVNVRLSGTASNGVDYALIPNVITIDAGALATDVKVDPIADTANRGNKTVILALQTNADYAIGQQRYAEVKIIDDSLDFPLPTVTLTAPTNHSAFDGPATITLTAEVSDPGVNVQSVSFYANDESLGHSATSPYSIVWSNPPPGQFALFARAVDQFGRSALSTPVQITIVDVDPVVKLTSPTNGANFIVHQDIPLAADVSDADTNATIVSVSFYANDHSLGSVTNAPYSLVWSNAPSGFFVLRAVAKDNSGDRGYSMPVLINVSPLSAKIISVSR